MTAVLALSIGSKVDHYGALAGVAAILGIGVLAILYAAQAREVKRLREWAGRAPERDADLQQRVVADAQARAAAPPAQPVARTQPATAAGVPAAVPGATAAVPPAMKLPGPATPAAAPAAAGAPARAPGAPIKPQPGGPAVPTPVSAPAAAAPSTAAGVTAAAAPGAPPAPGTATAAATTPATPPSPTAPATPAGAQPTMIVRPPEAAPRPRAAAPAPLRTTAREAAASAAPEHTRRNLAVVILGGVAIAAIAVLLITQVFNGSDPSTPAKPNRVIAPGQTTTSDTAGGGLPPIDRAATRVSVLNGTAVQGLARGASTKVIERGYTEGVVKTNPDQQVPTTAVYYVKGSNRQARDIARILGLDAAVVKPILPATQAAGGDAPVVVVVGLDQAQ